MSDTPSSQKRVAIWCVTRSLSSVFARCLSQMPDSLVLFEMFTTAAVNGPQRKCENTYKRHATETFESVKALCEQPWPGKSMILIKDMGYAMPGNFEMIPEGYQHIFLVRHPSKSIPSLESGLACIPNDQKEFYGRLNQFKPLFDLHGHVTSTLGLKATVVDADDLIINAEKTLQILCQVLGLPFSERLLAWDRSDGIPDNWMIAQAMWDECKSLGWLDNCLNSTGFIKPKKLKETEGKIKPNPMTPEIERMIEEALPYYQALHELRIKP